MFSSQKHPIRTAQMQSTNIWTKPTKIWKQLQICSSVMHFGTCHILCVFCLPDLYTFTLLECDEVHFGVAWAHRGLLGRGHPQCKCQWHPPQCHHWPPCLIMSNVQKQMMATIAWALGKLFLIGLCFLFLSTNKWFPLFSRFWTTGNKQCQHKTNCTYTHLHYPEAPPCSNGCEAILLELGWQWGAPEDPR